MEKEPNAPPNSRRLCLIGLALLALSAGLRELLIWARFLNLDLLATLRSTALIGLVLGLIGGAGWILNRGSFAAARTASLDGQLKARRRWRWPRFRLGTLFVIVAMLSVYWATYPTSRGGRWTTYYPGELVKEFGFVATTHTRVSQALYNPSAAWLHRAMLVFMGWIAFRLIRRHWRRYPATQS